MLVGGGVEHHLGPVHGEQLPQPLGVPDGGNLHHQVQSFAVVVQQLLLDVVGIVFVDIHDDEAPGVVLDDLAAQLGADGAASARYQDGFPAQEIVHRGRVQPHRLPAQQVLDLDFPQLAADGLLGDQVQSAGQDGDPHPLQTGQLL